MVSQSSISKMLPPQVRDFVVKTLGKNCTSKLVDAMDFKDKACVSLAVSKVVGLGIVAGSSLVKVPQLLKIVASGSAQGISLNSYILETVAYCIALVYNYRHGNPFSTYGESIFVTLQNFVIIALMLWYGRQVGTLSVVVAAFAGIVYALIDPTIVTEKYLMMAQTATIPISVSSKIPQIITNYSQQSTGQLSFLTVVLFFAGSLARIFTTMTEIKGDKVLLTGFTLATVFNGILLLQMFWYWNSKGVSIKRVAASKKTK
ncbi:hypothetical protein MP228_002747 [Amoeboaphelidium protococcarum]|nr:hypothetical protein MP228_002747 [Amoeboaphelidium protococcarum]